MMRSQNRVALSDVTSQVNNRANRYGENDKSGSVFGSVVDRYRVSGDNGSRQDVMETLAEQLVASDVSTRTMGTVHPECGGHLKTIGTEIENGQDVEEEEVSNEDEEDEDAETDNELEYEETDDSFVPLLPIVTADSERTYNYIYRRLHREEADPQDEDTWDPVMVSEYTTEIFQHLRFLEHKFSPNSRYIEQQPELTWSYRSTLIDWIVQVHDRFQLLPETLFLTINIIDRFLSKKQVTLNRLQLVGAAALFIAAKYEEINCPTLKDMLYMLDNAYSREEVLRAERFMINTLDFEFGWPGPMSFLRRVSKADDYEYDTRTVAKYLLETSLMEPELVSAPPSWLAAGAYYLSKIIIGLNGWADEHIYYSGYTEEQLIPLATVILDSCRHATERHKSIFEKYSKNRHRKSAQVVSKWISMAETRLEQR